jgi:putative phosphoribosyl transferase
LKFQDRLDAGNLLADKLYGRLKNMAVNHGNILILGIPRGGVIVGDIVAKKFSADFDIIIGRKLGAPANDELAIGAVMEDGTAYINQYLVDALKVSEEYIEAEKLKQANEIKRRKALYRKVSDYKIQDRVAILVDDGIATGATTVAAARWTRKQRPTLLIVAVPVAPSQTLDILKQESDVIEVVMVPAIFNAVGEFYENFDPVTDDQIIEIMRNRLPKFS